MTNFCLIGATGYIAPRHLKAIHDIDGQLLSAFDVNDNVGVMDSYFPDSRFFTEFELLDSFLGERRRCGEMVDYLSICSPNHLHKGHIAFGLQCGADVICEKPLVLEPEDIHELKDMERTNGKKVNCILQLRLHPSIVALREKIKNGPTNKVYNVDLVYFSSRDSRYHTSWKGDDSKSGGITANIGIHYYDVLGFLFGELVQNVVHHRSADCAAGYLEFQQARVRWVLSINGKHLPKGTPAGQPTYRSIKVDGDEIEFSDGFTDLHTSSYLNILSAHGYGLSEALPSIEIVSDIRKASLNLHLGEKHPDLKRIQEML